MKGSVITFKGKTLEGQEISFCISVPVLLSSIEIEYDEVAELKRKLAEVEGEREALRAVIEAMGKGAAELTTKNDALRGLNAELLEALEDLVAKDYESMQPKHVQRTAKACAAIAKAKKLNSPAK